MIRLMVFVPNPLDATSFYRGMGPLTQLVQRHDDLLIDDRETVINWATLAKYDAIFLQRPYTDQHLQICKIAYDNGVPLWVDYDDDLFTVPTDNPTFPVYGNKEVQKQVATIIAMANVVSVSTPHLAERYAPMNPNIKVIPNAMDDRLLKWRPIIKRDKQKLVLWRGSNTHHKDLACVAHELIEIANEYLDVTWEFIGFNPWFITDQMPQKQVIVAGAMDVMDYFRFLARTKPGIAVVPLFPNLFNKSKSNIAWMEAAFCGAPALVPTIPEWDRPGTVAYTTPTDFGQKLREMFKGAWDLAGLAKDSWDYITDNLMLSKTNVLRRELLSELTKKDLK